MSWAPWPKQDLRREYVIRLNNFVEKYAAKLEAEGNYIKAARIRALAVPLFLIRYR